jgi:osmotically-inducible protein OsmY
MSADHEEIRDMAQDTERATVAETEEAPGLLRKITDELGITTPESRPAEAPRGPKGYRRSDERIREDVCEALIRETEVDVSDVTVDVSEGVVTLGGHVPIRRMRYMIEDVAAACRGVTDVDNGISVAQMPDPRV